MNRTPDRPRPALLLLALLALMPGCATTPASDTAARTRLSGVSTPTEAQPSRETSSPSAARGEETIALLIGGEPVTWSTLRPLLAEAGGAEVVDELALEHALRRTLRARGLTVGPAEIDAARENWLALLADAGVSAEAESVVRRRRGLGEERFRRLMWRNAALRALVDPAEITPSDAEIGLARAIRTGRRYLASGVIARDTATALAISEGARTNAGGPLAGLWSVATERDLQPFQAMISPLDPAYPDSIRRALAGLPPRTPSGAIAVEEGYAVLVVDAVIEPRSSSADDAALRRELTIRKTRVAMERLARELVSRTEVTRLDRSLP